MPEEGLKPKNKRLADFPFLFCLCVCFNQLVVRKKKYKFVKNNICRIDLSVNYTLINLSHLYTLELEIFSAYVTHVFKFYIMFSIPL